MTELANFQRDLRDGRELGENRVRVWLGRRYVVMEASPDQQRRGIDLLVRDHVVHALWLTVEVKCQRTARDAFFVETHGGVIATQGWAFTCEADWIMFVDAAARFVIVLRTSTLQRHLPRWITVFGVRLGPAPETGRARGRGTWVPWSELHTSGRLYWFSGGEFPDLGGAP